MKRIRKLLEVEEFCEHLTRQLNGLIEEVEAIRRQVSMPNRTITPKLILQSRALADAAAALSLIAGKLRFYDLEDHASPHVLAEAERRDPLAPPTRGAAQAFSSKSEAEKVGAAEQVRRSASRVLRNGGDLHPMLARVLDDIARDSRPSPPTTAVVSWEARLSGFEDPQEAVLALRKLPTFRRAALLNLETGELWGAETQLEEIQKFLRSLELRQGRGRGFRHVGRIGDPSKKLETLRRSARAARRRRGESP